LLLTLPLSSLTNGILTKGRIAWRRIFHRGQRNVYLQQGVALTGRNYTGPPCSVGHPTAHAPGPVAVGPAAGSVTDEDRRRRQTTDACEQYSTGPLGGLVIITGSWIK